MSLNLLLHALAGRRRNVLSGHISIKEKNIIDGLTAMKLKVLYNKTLVAQLGNTTNSAYMSEKEI